MKRGIVLMAIVVLQCAPPAIAGQFAGRASVVDGDTIEIHSERIRISGIDAPESDQICYGPSGRSWRCGQRAALMLADYLGTGPVSCTTEGQDWYGRWLAKCTAHGRDLGEWLVRNGWAVPYFDHTNAYAEAQRAARASRLGSSDACGSVPTALGRTTKHVTIRLDDPGLSAFVDAARQCVTDEGHSLGLRKSARATLNMIERADPKE